MRFCLVSILLLLSGCAQSPAPVEPATRNQHEAGAGVQHLLKQQYAAWAGVPYRLGGENKRGVDCSALVQLTYRDQFKVTLPRSTDAQATVGVSVGRDAVRPGDLVFFKTGTRTRHVGMMVDEMRFLHASTSRGVMLSRLDNPYWARHYWQARRVM